MKNFLVNNFPFLGSWKRYIKALYDTSFTNKRSYSQFGEDVFILEYIEKNNLGDFPYIDIGANHPTDISNTILLYKKGYKGIVVEPNKELAQLFRTFRKRDNVLEVAMSENSGAVSFNISKTPVLSSMGQVDKPYKTYLVPMLTLNNVVKSLQYEQYSLISIDVEGFNLQVIKGGLIALNLAYLLCIEYDSPIERAAILDLLPNHFNQINEFGCNLIFENKKLLNKA